MNESLLVNTLGHAAGVLIFGLFLYLLTQDRSARRLRGSTKSMLAAALALGWNLTSLVVLGLRANEGVLPELTIAVSFSVLSLLPAVLFDLCLSDRLRVLAKAGYLLSGAAILLHIAELFSNAEPYHRVGLTLITVGFGVLTFLAAALGLAMLRLLGTMSLFLLAMSFVHLGAAHVRQIWSQELAFHHLAIPLALLVLLQDYRFVLLDAFLRFLVNILLAAAFVSVGVVAWQFGEQANADTAFFQALLLVGACLLLVAFAVLRARVQALVTRLVFRRPDEDVLIRNLKTAVSDESDYLQGVAGELGSFFGASSTAIEYAALDFREPRLVSEIVSGRAALEARGIEVVAPFRPSSGGGCQVLLGRRSGGRRYLSEDLQAITRAVSVVLEQIEQYRDSELRRLVAQAELRALQSQIHPHFLFNALNALYGIIPREAKGARDTVLNLADIFRYFLETRRTTVPLEEEMHIVKAYLEVERLRLGDKLRTEIRIAPEALAVPIPVLSIQPLVENAVKHGVAAKSEGGLISIRAEVRDRALSVAVHDDGPGFSGNGQGVGLSNVSKRLELCYGSGAGLDIQSTGQGSVVTLRIPVDAGQLVESL